MRVDVAAVENAAEYYDGRHERGWIDHWPEGKKSRVIALIREFGLALGSKILEYGCVLRGLSERSSASKTLIFALRAPLALVAYPISFALDKLILAFRDAEWRDGSRQPNGSEMHATEGLIRDAR